VTRIAAPSAAAPSAPSRTCKKRTLFGPPLASTRRRNAIGSSAPGSPWICSAASTVIVAASGKSELTTSFCPFALGIVITRPATLPRAGKFSQKRLKRPSVFDAARS